MPHAPNRVIQELKETRVGGSLVELADGPSRLGSVMSNREVILIQGTEMFVDAMCSELRGIDDVFVFGIIPDDRKETLFERSWPSMAVSRISHCQVGGVTRGRWKIFGDLKLRGIKSSPVKRVLKHILRSTEMGRKGAPSAIPKGGAHSPRTANTQ